MATERLVLPLENGPPTGYQLERLMLDHVTAAEDGWTIVTGTYDTRTAEAERIQLSQSLGALNLYADADGTVNGTYKGYGYTSLRGYQIHRVCFDAGPVVAMVPMNVTDVIEPGTVVGCANGHTYIMLRTERAIVAIPLLGMAECHYDNVAAYCRLCPDMQYFHVRARDAFVLK